MKGNEMAKITKKDVIMIYDSDFKNLRKKKGLTNNEVLFYAKIRQMCYNNKHGECYTYDRIFVDLFNLSFDDTHYSFKKLLALDLIEMTSLKNEYGNSQRFIRMRKDDHDR